MRTIVFDLDGTLADTSGDLIEAANTCFRDLGHGNMLTAEDALTAFTGGGRGMLGLGFSRLGHENAAAEIEAQFPRLIDAYEAAIAVHTQIYPGAVAAIEALKRDGARLAVCTNKMEYLARLLLQELDLIDYFDALIGADTMPSRKPDPLPYSAAVERAGGALADSCLIGDTQTDRDTARAAGVPCALVTFGPEGRAIERLAPEALLDHYDDLQQVVARMLD